MTSEQSNVVTPTASEEKSDEKVPQAVNSENQKADESEGGGLFGVSSQWYSNILQQAKEKTYSTYELVKRDIDEFSSAVHSEASHIASATSSALRDGASNLGQLLSEEEENGEQKREQEVIHSLPDKTTEPEPQKSEDNGWGWGGGGEWMSNLVKTVNKVLYVEDTTAGEEKIQIPITAETLTRSQARLYAIQTDRGTYCNEPEGAPELFDDWLDHFRMEEYKEQISELLGKNPQIRTLYAQLVPSEVSNVVFWQRYFYRKHLFDLDEARRDALLRRTEGEVEKERLEMKTSWGDSEDELKEDSSVMSETLDAVAKVVTQEPACDGDPQQELTPRANGNKRTPVQSPRGGQTGRDEKPSPQPFPPENISFVPSEETAATSCSDQSSTSVETSGQSAPLTLAVDQTQEPIKTQVEPVKDEHHMSDNSTDTWSVCSSKSIQEIPDSPPTTDVGAVSEVSIDGGDEGKASEGTPTPQEGKRRKTGEKNKDNEDWVDWDSE